MQVRSIAIDEIKPYEHNPRLNDAAVEKVAASIREFGWRQPIVVDPDMVVIAGHTRLKAAYSLGQDKVPVHIAKGLSDAQVRAYRLADNRTGEDAQWDMDLLATEFVALGEVDFDLKLTGFDDLEIKNLRNIDPIPPEQFPEFDESIPTEHTCPKCGYKWSGNA